jgi:hypothetical protein
MFQKKCDHELVRTRYNALVADGGLHIQSINTVKAEFNLTHKEAIEILGES